MGKRHAEVCLESVNNCANVQKEARAVWYERCMPQLRIEECCLRGLIERTNRADQFLMRQLAPPLPPPPPRAEGQVGKPSN